MHVSPCFSQNIWQYDSTVLAVPESAVYLVNCEILHSFSCIENFPLKLPFLKGNKENKVHSMVHHSCNYYANNWYSDLVSFQNLWHYYSSLSYSWCSASGAALKLLLWGGRRSFNPDSQRDRSLNDRSMVWQKKPLNFSPLKPF